MDRPKALGFLGGAFDPIHKGHLHMAQVVRRYFSLDKIYLIPNACPPHKQGSFSSYQDRLQMSKLALQSLNCRQYQVSTLEEESTQRHYTYDTLSKLRAHYGADARLFFILGMDSLLQLHTWHRGLELTDFAHLVVLTRPGYRFDLQQINDRVLKAYLSAHLVPFDPHQQNFKQATMLPLGKIFLVPSREDDVSSTQLRAQLAALSVQASPTAPLVHNMLSEPVLNYIRTHQLYRPKN